MGAIQRLAEEMTTELKAQAAAGQPLSSKGVSFGTVSNRQGIDADSLSDARRTVANLAENRESSSDTSETGTSGTAGARGSG